MTRILIADDDPAVCRLIHRILIRAELGEQIEIARNGQQTLDQLRNGRFDLALIDIFMPRLSGLEAVQAAREQGVDTDVIALTGQATVDVIIQALKSQVQDFIPKPFQPCQRVDAVRELLGRRHPSPHFLADKIDTFLRENAARIELHLADLCQHFHLSPAYVTQLLRQHLDMGFRQRLNYHRIHRARKLLASTDLPIKQVATRCGFKTQARLTEAFGRLEKTTPGRFRQFCRDRPMLSGMFFAIADLRLNRLDLLKLPGSVTRKRYTKLSELATSV